MAGVWQGRYKYLLGFLIVLASGTAAGLLGKLSDWHHLSASSIFWPFFTVLVIGLEIIQSIYLLKSPIAHTDGTRSQQLIVS